MSTQTFCAAYGLHSRVQRTPLSVIGIKSIFNVIRQLLDAQFRGLDISADLKLVLSESLLPISGLICPEVVISFGTGKILILNHC